LSRWRLLHLQPASIVKRIGRGVELNAWVQHERWKAPICPPSSDQNDGAFEARRFQRGCEVELAPEQVRDYSMRMRGLASV